MKKGKVYNQRVWLNSKSLPSSGSVVAFDGMVQYHNFNEKKRTLFFEVADCNQKVRLHISADESVAQFTKKIERLRDAADKFLTHLKNRESVK